MRRILAVSSVVFLVALYVRAQSPKKASVARAKAKAAVAMTYGNSEAITELELKVYDYFLASDQLEGRNLPSRGYDTAALYVASHLAEWGLKPGGSTEKTNGPLQPYFMPFELATRSVVTEESKISLTAPGGGGGRGGRGGGAGGAGGAQAGGAQEESAAATGQAAADPAGGGRGGRGGRGGGGPRTTDFEYGKDWTMGGGGRGGGPAASLALSGNLAFVGNGYIVNKTKTDPYEGLDVKGKIVVVAGLPAEIAAQQEAAGGGRGGGGAGATNPLGEPCTDFLNPEQAAAKAGAIGVITIPNFQQLSAGGNAGGRGGFGGAANGPAYVAPKLQAPPLCPVVPAVTAGLALANALFQGQKKSASQIFYGAGGGAKQDSFEFTPEAKLSLKLTVKSEPGHAENVIAMLEGSDPVKKNEYVVISAHLDHIGLSNAAAGGDNVNNGADDDGSGSTALLGIAHAYAEGAAKGMRPERTMIFLWNAGEEKGLWGSQYFAQFPPVDIHKVVAALNIDMIGRTAEPGYTDPDKTHVLVKPGEIMVVGPNISSDEMEKTLETVNDGYQKLVLNHFYDTTAPDKTHDNLGPQPRGQRIFYRSDHYNFAKMGVPVVFFTDGLHVDYHRVTDSPDKIDYVQMVKVTKTLSAMGWVLANQQGRIKLNEKLPDQLVKDMKLVQTQGWGKLTPVMAPLPGEPF